MLFRCGCFLSSNNNTRLKQNDTNKIKANKHTQKQSTQTHKMLLFATCSLCVSVFTLVIVFNCLFATIWLHLKHCFLSLCCFCLLMCCCVVDWCCLLFFFFLKKWCWCWCFVVDVVGLPTNTVPPNNKHKGNQAHPCLFYCVFAGIAGMSCCLLLSLVGVCCSDVVVFLLTNNNTKPKQNNKTKSNQTNTTRTTKTTIKSITCACLLAGCCVCVASLRL